MSTAKQFAAAIAESEGDLAFERSCATIIVDRFADYASVRAGDAKSSEDFWHGLSIALDSASEAKQDSFALLLCHLINAEVAGLLPQFAVAVEAQLRKHSAAIGRGLDEVYRRTA